MLQKCKRICQSSGIIDNETNKVTQQETFGQRARTATIPIASSSIIVLIVIVELLMN